MRRAVKKTVPIVPILRLLPLKLKEYPGKGNLYNFMLEEVRDYGPTNVGKFASADRRQAEVLVQALKDEINETRKQGQPRQH